MTDLRWLGRPVRSIALAERCLLVSVSLVLMNTLFTRGVAGLMLDVTRFFRSLPGVEYLLTLILRGEVKGALSLLAGPTGEKKGKSDGSEDANAASVITPIPEKGIPLQQIERQSTYNVCIYVASYIATKSGVSGQLAPVKRSKPCC